MKSKKAFFLIELSCAIFIGIGAALSYSFFLSQCMQTHFLFKSQRNALHEVYMCYEQILMRQVHAQKTCHVSIKEIFENKIRITLFSLEHKNMPQVRAKIIL